jgi:RimJ/RimL family protein N-acetyltransferase
MIETVFTNEQKVNYYKFMISKAEVNFDLHSSSYIGFKEDNKIIGAIFFSNYDKHNVFIHIAFDTPRCVSRKHIKLMFDYIFNQLNCRRTTATCDSENNRVQKLIEGVGFTQEGLIRKMVAINNKEIDVIIYGMLKNECRWI